MSVPGQKLLGSVLCLPSCLCITAIYPQGPTASLFLPESAQELLGGERDKKQRKLTRTGELGLVGGTPAHGREVGIKLCLRPFPTQITLWFHENRSPVWWHLHQHSDPQHTGMGMPCPLSYTGPCFSLSHCYPSSQGLLTSCCLVFMPTVPPGPATPFMWVWWICLFPLKHTYCTVQELDSTEQSPQPQTVSDLSLRNGFLCDIGVYTYIKKE